MVEVNHYPIPQADEVFSYCISLTKLVKY